MEKLSVVGHGSDPERELRKMARLKPGPPRASRWMRALAQEALRPRSWREWLDASLQVLGLIPVLQVPVEVLNLSLLWLERDYWNFGLALAGIVCLPGMWGALLKIVRQAKKLWRSFCSGLAAGKRAASASRSAGRVAGRGRKQPSFALAA